MKQLRSDLYAVRGWFVLSHLLVTGRELVLIDTGLIGDARRIRRAVERLGELKAILLTHGHLDHTANAAALQDWSGAKVYAPVGDEDHVAGTHRYRGVARVCGWMEAAGRAALRYRPPRVDVWIRDGDELPFWGGLRVIGLPGHTAGHVGFLAPGKRVFFPGDAFAVSWRIALPPAIFNTDSRQVRASFRKAAGVEADLFVPAHYFWLPANLPVKLRR
jgi:glyoxylase-like metal-dependent hydrolase (beta-lactamase superfamily II)